MPSPLPIAVLVSGSGTNLQALIDAEAGRTLDCRIVVVISDRPDIAALDRATAAGIPTEVVPWAHHRTREAFTTAVCDATDRYGARGLVLAGFMRILAPEAVSRFPDAIVNVHPALLPAFPGADAVDQALAYGVTVSGVTVHFVDEQVDHGPIILQEAVPVESGDDAASLHARLQTVEHRLLPLALSALGRGVLKVEGRRVTWAEPAQVAP
jgi:phosphoribosylglycinamide formyltransferase-1